jgi:hypothetical protein
VKRQGCSQEFASKGCHRPHSLHRDQAPQK